MQEGQDGKSEKIVLQKYANLSFVARVFIYSGLGLILLDIIIYLYNTSINNNSFFNEGSPSNGIGVMILLAGLFVLFMIIGVLAGLMSMILEKIASK